MKYLKNINENFENTYYITNNVDVNVINSDVIYYDNKATIYWNLDTKYMYKSGVELFPICKKIKFKFYTEDGELIEYNSKLNKITINIENVIIENSHITLIPKDIELDYKSNTAIVNF